MNYDLIKAVIKLVQQFMEKHEAESVDSIDIDDFIEWMNMTYDKEGLQTEKIDWIGKEKGRSSDSIINTLFVRISRYAKSYSRAVMNNSVFSSQDDFIYLISLRSMGAMSKMELIRYNVHEKSAGMLIINRLIHHGWIEQSISKKDKRRKHIQITEDGLIMLDRHMDKIRKASRIVIGDLTYSEQMQLIAILSKLDEFHYSVYRMNLETVNLLETAYKKLN